MLDVLKPYESDKMSGNSFSKTLTFDADYKAFVASVFESKRAIVEATDKLTVYPVASSRMAAYLITVTPEDNFADPR